MTRKLNDFCLQIDFTDLSNKEHTCCQDFDTLGLFRGTMNTSILNVDFLEEIFLLAAELEK